MSQTNAILGTAFQDPDVVAATIDPMGMIKIHFGAMPVFAGLAQRWASGPGGRCQEVGLSEYGGTPGFEASTALIVNQNYKGPPLPFAPGTVRTTAMIQAEARLKEAAILDKAQAGRPSPHPTDAQTALGLPPQPETQAPDEGSAINRPTPVEGLVGFRMAPREATAAPLLTTGPLGKFPTAAEIAAAAAVAGTPDVALQPESSVPAELRQPPGQDELAELLSPRDPNQVETRAMLRNLILALDIGFNGNHDLKKMRAAIAGMADAVRKGLLND